METKERTLTQTTIQNVRGDELPRRWAELVGAADDDELIVQIIPKRLAWQKMKDAMNELSQQAEKNGLTEEKLEEILNEIADERRKEHAAGV